MADTFVVADILTFMDSIVQEFFNFYYCKREARHRSRARRCGFARPPIQIIADINAASLLGSNDNGSFSSFRVTGLRTS
jgi:hypothetical protein